MSCISITNDEQTKNAKPKDEKSSTSGNPSESERFFWPFFGPSMFPLQSLLQHPTPFTHSVPGIQPDPFEIWHLARERFLATKGSVCVEEGEDQSPTPRPSPHGTSESWDGRPGSYSSESWADPARNTSGGVRELGDVEHQESISRASDIYRISRTRPLTPTEEDIVKGLRDLGVGQELTVEGDLLDLARNQHITSRSAWRKSDESSLQRSQPPSPEDPGNEASSAPLLVPSHRLGLTSFDVTEGMVGIREFQFQFHDVEDLEQMDFNEKVREWNSGDASSRVTREEGTAGLPAPPCISRPPSTAEAENNPFRVGPYQFPTFPTSPPSNQPAAHAQVPVNYPLFPSSGCIESPSSLLSSEEPNTSQSMPGQSIPLNSVRRDMALQETIRNLRDQLVAANAQVNRLSALYEYSCGVSNRHIAIREATIAGYRLQLRQAGLHPYGEIDPAKPPLANEFIILFKSAASWAKQFYKFPTQAHMHHDLQRVMMCICEDAGNAAYLMGDQSTKYLVVVAIATRYIMKNLFGKSFLKTIMEKTDPQLTDEQEFVARMRNDPKVDEEVFSHIQTASVDLANHFLYWIRPMMSRCSDQAHIEQSSRQFIQICQHAGRIFHEVIKTKVVLHVVFTRFNDVFYSENMKMVNGNTLGLDTPERPAEVAWSEIRASAVRICMFPYIAAIFEEMGGALHVLCKSNVLLV